MVFLIKIALSKLSHKLRLLKYFSKVDDTYLNFNPVISRQSLLPVSATASEKLGNIRYKLPYYWIDVITNFRRIRHHLHIY